MRINREIRADKVRLIDEEGKQLGIYLLRDAINLAEKDGKDLIEISPNAEPPVCKVISMDKFKYLQAKKEKENKKAQHQVKVKEIKVKPNIDTHDLQVKIKHAKGFLEEGNKVRITCMFKGRELLHVDLGEKVVQTIIEELKDISMVEAPVKLFGKSITCVIAPAKK